MPKDFCRIKLEITNIRIGSAYNISTEDIIAEGLRTNLRGHDAKVDLEEQWAHLWDSINAKRGYGYISNPLVWVIEYKIIE